MRYQPPPAAAGSTAATSGSSTRTATSTSSRHPRGAEAPRARRRPPDDGDGEDPRARAALTFRPTPLERGPCKSRADVYFARSGPGARLHAPFTRGDFANPLVSNELPGMHRIVCRADEVASWSGPRRVSTCEYTGNSTQPQRFSPSRGLSEVCSPRRRPRPRSFDRTGGFARRCKRCTHRAGPPGTGPGSGFPADAGGGFYFARVIDSMTTGVSGTSFIPAFTPVGTALILSITSIPSTTFPKTQ